MMMIMSGMKMVMFILNENDYQHKEDCDAHYDEDDHEYDEDGDAYMIMSLSMRKMGMFIMMTMSTV